MRKEKLQNSPQAHECYALGVFEAAQPPENLLCLPERAGGRPCSLALLRRARLQRGCSAPAPKPGTEGCPVLLGSTKGSLSETEAAFPARCPHTEAANLCKAAAAAHQGWKEEMQTSRWEEGSPTGTSRWAGTDEPGFSKIPWKPRHSSSGLGSLPNRLLRYLSTVRQVQSLPHADRCDWNQKWQIGWISTHWTNEHLLDTRHWPCYEGGRQLLYQTWGKHAVCVCVCNTTLW